MLVGQQSWFLKDHSNLFKIRLARGMVLYLHTLPLNQMQTGSRVNNAANLPGLQSKGGDLELFLHVTFAKEAPGIVSHGRARAAL